MLLRKVNTFTLETKTMNSSENLHFQLHIRLAIDMCKELLRLYVLWTCDSLEREKAYFGNHLMIAYLHEAGVNLSCV